MTHNVLHTSTIFHESMAELRRAQARQMRLLSGLLSEAALAASEAEKAHLERHERQCQQVSTSRIEEAWQVVRDLENAISNMEHYAAHDDA